MNYQDYLKSFRLALDDEIKYLRKKGGQKTYLSDGLYLGSRGEQHIYSFTAETEILFPDDTQIDLEFNRKRYTGTILSSEGFEIVLSLSPKIGDRIATAILLTSPWFLLEELKKRLDEISLSKKANKHLAEQILQDFTAICDRNLQSVEQIFTQIQNRTGINIQCNDSQKRAIENGLNQNVSFVWGPPGTGKTSTLGLAVAALVHSGESVLVVAHSNTAVDTAMKSVAKYLQGYSLFEEGFVLRHGVATPQSLDDFPKLNARNILHQQKPQLIETIEVLEKRKRDLVKHSRQSGLTLVKRQQIQSELSIVKRKSKQLKDLFGELEIELIKKAKVVGCTFSKAAIASEIYQRPKQFDAVVIDEASMAYISQCFFVSTLAKRSILIFGDFRQLGPISQAKTDATTEWLERDIFEQAGISKKVNRGLADERLVLLNTQYRMHPAISDISNRLFYGELLKNGSQVETNTLSILEKEPLAGSPLAVYDISHLSAFCIKETQSHSRFNFISAFVAVDLALQSLQSNHLSIGITTPYNAQARLIKCILKDLSLDKKIKVAKVHRFQGSEQNVIIFDAVEGKPQANIGLPIKGGMQSSAARLANVAVSRAQGKFIAIVNYQYFAQKLDSFNIFRKFIERVKARASVKTLKWQENNTKSQIIAFLPNLSLFYDAREALNVIELDLKNAEEEIAIYWSNEQILPFFPLRLLKHCSNRGIRFFLSGIAGHQVAKELQNTQLCNTSLKINMGLIGIDQKNLWIYLNTTTAFPIVFKINSPQTIKLLYNFFSLIPHSDPGSKPEDLGRCPVCRQLLWIKDERFSSYLVCTKSISHHKKKISAKNATTIARFMKITCGDCGRQVKGCVSAKNNSVFLACTNSKCKWTKSLKTII